METNKNFDGGTTNGSGGPIMKFFGSEHLPVNLQAISKPFADLANWANINLPAGAETTVALRRILEAKDCAVRAVL